MSRQTNLNRRAFLIGSAAISGGVAFGFLTAWSRALAHGHDSSGATHALTPFVQIGVDGITLITPRTDMGQGISSTQAYLIAEELDVDPLKCHVSPGFPNPIYYNSAVADSLSPYPEYDHSDEAEQARLAGRESFRQAGMQVTGGSTSIPDMYDRLRTTGAVARETLKLAAAQQFDVALAELTTEDGHVVLPTGRRVTYESLAATAATLTPPNDVALRPPSEWRHLGKALTRTDIVAKSTGTQNYGIDAQAEGMLHATVRTHPAWGGEMLGFDASRAEKMPGVRKVVALENGIGVIADRTWRAFKAMETIEFRWGEGTFPKSSAELWAALENGVKPELLEGRLRNEGNVDASLAKGGAGTLEAEYRVPYLAHAPLEPMNAMVRVGDDRVDIWTGTQIPGFVQAHVAGVTNTPADRVFV
ncbi:MAG: molybdopterin cofactor-binding domain-containing protein, partial [Pseudomonadota bacterium]